MALKIQKYRKCKLSKKIDRITQIELINAPIVKVLLECDNTTLLAQVELPSSVKIYHCSKVAGMSVEIVFVILGS